MEEKVLFFNISYQTTQVNRQLIPDEYSNGVMVINTGTTLALANGLPLNPGVAGVRNGESFLFGGNRAEIFRGRIEITFPNGAAAGNSVFIMQKIYSVDLMKNPPFNSL